MCTHLIYTDIGLNSYGQVDISNGKTQAVDCLFPHLVLYMYVCTYILCTERFKYAGKNYSLLRIILLTVISPIINELKAKKNQHFLKMKPWFEPLKWSCKHSYTYYSLIVLFIQCLAFCVMYTYHTYIIYLFLWPMLQFWPYLQGKYDN